MDTGEQLCALNFYAEVSSKIVKLLFPIPVNICYIEYI